MLAKEFNDFCCGEYVQMFSVSSVSLIQSEESRGDLHFRSLTDYFLGPFRTQKSLTLMDFGEPPPLNEIVH